MWSAFLTRLTLKYINDVNRLPVDRLVHARKLTKNTSFMLNMSGDDTLNTLVIPLIDWFLLFSYNWLSLSVTWCTGGYFVLD